MKTFLSWCAVFAFVIAVAMKVWGNIDSTWDYGLMALIGFLCITGSRVV